MWLYLFHICLYYAYAFLSILELEIIHVSKKGPRFARFCSIYNGYVWHGLKGLAWCLSCCWSTGSDAYKYHFNIMSTAVVAFSGKCNADFTNIRYHHRIWPCCQNVLHLGKCRLYLKYENIDRNQLTQAVVLEEDSWMFVTISWHTADNWCPKDMCRR